MSELHLQNELIIAHVPVIHRGYTELADRNPSAEFGVLDSSILGSFDYLRKDIRSLHPEQAVSSLEGLGYSSRLVGAKALETYMVQGETKLIMPYDDISDRLIKLYGTPQSKIAREAIFLRWDRKNTQVNIEITPDRVVSSDDNELVLQILNQEADMSNDWWRHVSAAIVKEGELLTATHNRALPTQQSHYIDGDPRITQSRGTNIEASLFLHAESDAIAKMAKDGIAIEGSSLFVSTFPCPNCAKLIAASGVDKCYFVEGYAMLDGFEVLKSANIEIIKIDTKIPTVNERSLLKPYPSS